jgi:hypothetical protein
VSKAIDVVSRKGVAAATGRSSAGAGAVARLSAVIEIPAWATQRLAIDSNPIDYTAIYESLTI